MLLQNETQVCRIQDYTKVECILYWGFLVFYQFPRVYLRWNILQQLWKERTSSIVRSAPNGYGHGKKRCVERLWRRRRPRCWAPAASPPNRRWVRPWRGPPPPWWPRATTGRAANETTSPSTATDAGWPSPPFRRVRPNVQRNPLDIESCGWKGDSDWLLGPLVIKRFSLWSISGVLDYQFFLSLHKKKKLLISITALYWR